MFSDMTETCTEA